MKKLAAISAALVIAAAGLSGCASQSAASSAEATRENPMILSLAHGLSETHTVHIAMTEFAQNVEDSVTLPGDPSTQTLPAYLIDCRIKI